MPFYHIAKRKVRYKNNFSNDNFILVGGEEIKLFSSDYGSAQIIEESEYLRKHASHLQVLTLMNHFAQVTITC